MFSCIFVMYLTTKGYITMTKQQFKELNLTYSDTSRTKANEIARGLFNDGMRFQDAQRKAWQIVRLRIAMKTNIVKFSFTKTNGQRREYWGTLNPAFFIKRSPSSKKRNCTSSKQCFVHIAEDGRHMVKSFLPINYESVIETKSITTLVSIALTQKIAA